MNRLIRAVIDTRALRSNLAAVRARAPGAQVMAVVKANAYGHGLVPTALALADADAFAVARLEEGLALRASGVTKAIVLLEGVFSSEQLMEAARHGFDIVVHDPMQIDLLEAFSGQHRFVVWLKIDTGMNRLGFRPADFPIALARVRALIPAPLEIRVLTHLARADDRDEAGNREQIARFNAAVGTLDCATSIANSAGVLSGAGIHADWVRPGLALYGVSPFADQTARDLGLQPVMALESRVLTVRHVPKGETVGYGGVWRAPKDSSIAIVAAGYGDGLPRNLPSDTPVLIGGKRAPVAGRVSMDMIAVDVSGLPPVRVGDPVTLWGEGLPVEEIARHAGTIPYELLCGVSQRVPLELR
ncbi:MAG: alanine racemase [Steroidobacteraceae bacterium]|nr:alanine racemase [Steroidobacteraceae bacterium]